MLFGIGREFCHTMGVVKVMSNGDGMKKDFNSKCNHPVGIRKLFLMNNNCIKLQHRNEILLNNSKMILSYISS